MSLLFHMVLSGWYSADGWSCLDFGARWGGWKTGVVDWRATHGLSSMAVSG